MLKLRPCFSSWFLIWSSWGAGWRIAGMGSIRDKGMERVQRLVQRLMINFWVVSFWTCWNGLTSTRLCRSTVFWPTITRPPWHIQRRPTSQPTHDTSWYTCIRTVDSAWFIHGKTHLKPSLLFCGAQDSWFEVPSWTGLWSRFHFPMLSADLSVFDTILPTLNFRFQAVILFCVQASPLLLTPIVVLNVDRLKKYCRRASPKVAAPENASKEVKRKAGLVLRWDSLD